MEYDEELFLDVPKLLHLCHKNIKYLFVYFILLKRFIVDSLNNVMTDPEEKTFPVINFLVC